MPHITPKETQGSKAKDRLNSDKNPKGIPRGQNRYEVAIQTELQSGTLQQFVRYSIVISKFEIFLGGNLMSVSGRNADASEVFPPKNFQTLFNTLSKNNRNLLSNSNALAPSVTTR